MKWLMTKLPEGRTGGWYWWWWVGGGEKRRKKKEEKRDWVLELAASCLGRMHDASRT